MTTNNKNGSAEFEKFIDALKNIIPNHCERCGAKYLESDFELMKKEEGQSLIHIQCHSCKNNYLLNIYSPQHGVIGSTRAKLNLDTNDRAEIAHFTNQGVLSIDEALDSLNTLLNTKIIETHLKNKK